MPALRQSEFTARVVWLGHVPDRGESLRAVPQESVALSYGGVPGEAHGGLTRPSCSRVVDLYPKGTEIRNVRQMTILSAEELQEIANEMGAARFDPAWAGASMVIEGIPDFSHVPPSARLQGPGGVTVTVDMQNRPCNLPGPVIEADAPGAGRAFKRAADGRRGVTAWVEREGRLAVGDALRLFVPDQRAWNAG
ncbi:MAG: sulfurase [Sediminimonas sp.]|uniref:MOSC domain-containing protein n=1 Tax=Sediminimonas sp. TaxID=2823379 RepID=UPI00286FC159|nr:MOSC domain-containing protein [Sediminimonas sp.]MDR9484114.1 sulfurase [Sediminimonas sp.]